MEDLKTKAKEVQEQLDKLNALTKDLEGEGCKIMYTVSEPFNKIDFVRISKTVTF